jgi:hypothetical protein
MILAPDDSISPCRPSQAVAPANPPAFSLEAPEPPLLPMTLNSKRILAEIHRLGCTIPSKETYGRRYANYMQRLRARIYLQCCRSDVLSRTWLFDPKAL